MASSDPAHPDPVHPDSANHCPAVKTNSPDRALAVSPLTVSSGSTSRRRSRLFITLIVSVASVLALAACSASSSNSGQSNNSQNSTTQNAANTDEVNRNISDTGPESFTVLGNGDILIHNSLWMEAESEGNGTMNFAPQLAGIKNRVSSADLAICQMETPLAKPGGPYGSYPVFNTPPQIATAIAATGYDSCTTASNHTLDAGFEGVKRTIDTLAKAGVKNAGSSRTEAESKQFNIMDVKGVKVAHLAYATDFNGFQPPADKGWCCNKLSADRAIADAKAARAAGAQVVVVAMHAGTENDPKPNAAQVKTATQIAKSHQVDLILGDHVHVVQPVQKIEDMWVAYGMGNLISGQYETWLRNREGVTVEFTFTRQSDGSYKITKEQGYPTFNQAHPTRVVDLVAQLPKDGGGDPRWQVAYNQTKKTLYAMGAHKDGFVVPDPQGP